MTRSSPISEQLERQSVIPMECTIPTDMTIDEWRRRRSSRSPRRRSPRLFAVARPVVVPLRPEPCDHLHETTTRYDFDQKLLTFLLVCPVCRTEKVVETRHYQPRYEPGVAAQPAPATVHQLPVRGHRQPLRRAA